MYPVGNRGHWRVLGRGQDGKYRETGFLTASLSYLDNQWWEELEETQVL
jgi:hypothetical protein